MEEQTAISEDYKKWFNRGYHLRSTMPQVFKDMSVPKGEPKEITEAFEAGRKQFEREYDLTQERDDYRERIQEQLKDKRKSRDMER